MNFLAMLSRNIDRMNEKVGRFISWAALVMVLVQFFVVILRYVFAFGFIPLQESIWYLHGILFMIGAGYTLLHNGHVRVDIFYSVATPKRKAQIDLLGVIFFLIPICLMTLYMSWGYVINSWKVLEGSMETTGLPMIFLLKSVIWLFVFFLGTQGISLAIRSFFIIKDQEALLEKPPV